MRKIGLLSDTHSFLSPLVFEYFKDCDEIWHAGDFGNLELSDALSNFKPLRGVYGNVDGTELRKVHPEFNRFLCEEVDVLITHIGGYPGSYAPKARAFINAFPPKLFISGHSHILKVMRDAKYNNMLHINPGAAGNEGFHKVKTMVRFVIDGKIISKLEVIELGRK